MSTMMMSRFGRSLASRGAGREAYLAVSSELGSHEGLVILDFDGVEAVSNSFADAVFGRLALEMGMGALRELFTFRNVDPVSARIIRSVMDLRESQREPEPMAVC